MYRDRTLQKRSCKTAQDLEFFEASEAYYRERLDQIKLQKKDNRKKLKAVERCLERDGSLLEAELEMRIPVDDMVDLVDVEKDEVPGNPYRVQEYVVVEKLITGPFVEAITDAIFEDEIIAEVGVAAETVVTGVEAVANAVITDIESTVETEIDVMAVNGESGLQNDDIREYGKTVRLPSDKADYMRMSVDEKVRCYPFDDKGTDAAFDMVRTYFENIGMDTSFDFVYEETKLLTDYYEKQKAEEFIGERAERVIETMELLGIDTGRIAGYSADVLSEVFGVGDMEYFAGIKLFNKVIDRLGVDIDLQKRYEVFDHIYEAGMLEKKVERNRNSR